MVLSLKYGFELYPLDMTEEQWKRIALWAAGQLKKKRTRTIAPEHLSLRFLLKSSPWPALRKRVATERQCVFTVHKPNGKIEFRRVEN
jgi:hypothetical protein